MAFYKIEYISDGTLKVTKPGSTALFYRTTYERLITKTHGIDPKHRYIVYLLIGKKEDNRDALYVGKSTGGVNGRPRQHEDDKKTEWQYCIIFTSSDGEAGDGVIQTIENDVKTAIGQFPNRYFCDTSVSSANAGNRSDKEIAKTFMPAIMDVYDILGVHLKSTTDLDHFVHDNPGFVTDSSDYSGFNLPKNMIDWFRNMESITKKLDKKSETIVKKTYVAIKHNDLTVAYCYPIKSQNTIRIYFRGTADMFSDPRITERPEKVHNGDCKAMFYIWDDDDLRYFELFLKTAMEFMDKKKG